MDIHVENDYDLRDAAEFHGWEGEGDPQLYLEIKGFTVIWEFGHALIPILDEEEW